MALRKETNDASEAVRVELEHGECNLGVMGCPEERTFFEQTIDFLEQNAGH